MPKERGEAGEYVENITLDDVRGVFDDVEGPVVLSADVADALGCSRETARRKLAQLHDRGELARRKVARRVLYWRPESADESDAGAATWDEGGSAGVSPGDTDDGQRTTTRAREDDASEDPETILRGVDLPARSDAVLDARIDAILGMYDHLRERTGETVAKDDLLALVDPDDVRYSSASSFWNNCVKANASQGREQNALVALPGVVDWGGGEYRYSPE